MGLRDLFRRTTEPQDWAELWTVLRPLGGRITPDSLDRMSAEAARLPRATLVRADEQLGQAMALLDTEEHARHLSRDAWVAPDEPFGRRRFVRAVHAVLAAGPDAVVRVAEEPSVLRSYDSPDVPGFVARVRDDSLARRLDDAISSHPARGTFVGNSSDTSSEITVGAEKGWPSLEDADSTRDGTYPFESLDPEGVWLTLTMETPLDDEGWDAESDVATERLVVALGDRNPPEITSRKRLEQAWVQLVVPDEDADPEGYDLSLGELNVVMHLDAGLVESVPRDQRVDVLVRSAAAALLRISPHLTDEAVDTLRRLAG